ncbi:MAG: preprotein translocase subunit SecG [Candidatus Omnitrophica bacterium]|nr:preprotein translocase subunit SecG [Candidatus Omnitrophota bacterium]MCF7888328.1 preprotein translocase subunit SecG [Candidatus Omnitrophota bacterium]
MYKIVLILHIVVAISLIGMILVQRGRSGGLVEALGGVESIFGTKTSSLLVKLTVIFTVIFFLTSISLAYLYKQKAQKQDKSLLEVEQQVDEKAE